MKKIFKTILIIFLLVFFLWLFLKQIDIEKAKFYLFNTKLKFVFIMLLLFPFIYYFRALRWKYLLGEDGKKAKIFDVYSANIIGFAFNYVLPARIGEFARSYILGKKSDISVGFVFGTVIIERILDLGTMVFFAGIFYLLKPFTFKNSDANLDLINKSSFAGFVLFIALSIVFILIFLLKEKTLKFWRKFCHKVFPHKIGLALYDFGGKLIKGLIVLFESRRKFAIIINSLVIWLLISAGYWFALMDFNLTMNFVNILPYIIALMVGAFVPTPGMVGGFEAFSQLTLTNVYGMNNNMAGAATILIHIALIIGTLLISIPFFIKEGRWVLDINKYKRRNK